MSNLKYADHQLQDPETAACVQPSGSNEAHVDFDVMFISCKQCIIANLFVCEHTKAATILACKAFQIRMQRISPCKTSSEIRDINPVIIPAPIADFFDSFEVEPNGNCFYSSISVCLSKRPNLEKYLRRAAGLEYFMRPSIQKMLTKRGISQVEVVARARETVWADSTSIYLMSSVLSKRIEVIHLMDNGRYNNCYYDANSAGTQERIYVFLHRNHFSPLIPKAGDNELPQATCSPFRHGEDLHIESLKLSSKEEVEVIDLSTNSTSPAKAPRPTPIHHNLIENNEFGESMKPLAYFSRANEHFTRKAELIEIIRKDLEQAVTSNQYAEVCTKHHISTLQKQSMKTMRQRLNIRSESEKQLTSSPEATCIQNLNPPQVQQIMKSKSAMELLNAGISNPRISEKPEIDTSDPSYRKVGANGKYKPDWDQIFEDCIKFIAENIRFLQKNESKPHSETRVHEYVMQCAKSRSNWIQPAPLGTKFTKNQQLLREKYSKNIFKALHKPLYQQRFVQMLRECGADASSEAFLTEMNLKPTKSTMDAELKEKVAKDTVDQIRALPMDSLENEDLYAENDFVDESFNDVDNLIGKQAIAGILNVDISELEYTPPTVFDISIGTKDLAEIFDFGTETFRKRKWSAKISKALTNVQGACCFKARRQPTYHQKSSSGFATVNGKCGCDLEFVGQVMKKPVKDEPLIISMSTKGIFNLMQGTFTGRPLSGADRDEMAKRLQNVKAEAVYLENVSHLSAVRLLHGNQPQPSRKALRKLKSEKKLKNRLDPDPVKDIMLQEKQYVEASHPKATIKGYIQYHNLNPGHFKIILYDQGSLSLHADQASKTGTFCYIDSTGGVISKINKKEILLYRILGKRIAECGSYVIAEMLSERGTIVELTDFLKRIKQDLLKVRPSFNKPMCEIVVVDWSWPLLHSSLNAWNTETIQDYINRSFALFSCIDTSAIDWGKKSCIFICTSHLINACYRNLCRRINAIKQRNLIMPLALASVARLQECFSLGELRYVTRDITDLFGRPSLNSATLDNICDRLKEHKKVMDLITEKDIEICYDTDNAIALELSNSKHQKLLREQSPFFHIFKMEREKWMKLKQEDTATVNPFHCPVVLDMIEKDKIAMFSFWASAIPRKVTKSNAFLRETNSTVESSFHQTKNVQSPGGPVGYHDFVRRQYIMHTGKNKDTLSNLVQQQVQESVIEKPTLLLSETWKKKAKKGASHFSPKVTSSRTRFSLGQNRPDNSNSNNPGLFPLHGIPNVGNTCYMNAALQIILSIPTLMESTAVDSSVQFLFRFLNSRVQSAAGVSEKDALKVIECVGELLKNNKHSGFPIGIQHDATEFFISFLDLPEMKNIKDQFAITLINNHFCTSCGHENRFNDVTTNLDIDITNGFEAGLSSFLNNPEVSDCSRCNAKTMINCVELANQPKYLLIATNLLKGNLDNHGKYTLEKQRFNDFVSRSLEIDNVPYDLHGFICHRGFSAEFGHFVAYLCMGDRLVCYNDASIERNVDRPIGDIYMYLYCQRVAPSLPDQFTL